MDKQPSYSEMKPGSKQKISFKNTDSNSESVIKQKNVPLPKASIYIKNDVFKMVSACRALC